MKREPRMFSVDNAKAAKAVGFGWLNAIHYMAPHALAGVGNLCPHASEGCKALCLGWYSGHAGMVARDSVRASNSVRRSRITKARMFMRDRQSYLYGMMREIDKVLTKAYYYGLKPCIRLNGSTDIAWERLRMVDNGLSLVETYPQVQFVDYTKSKKRAIAWANGQLPINLDLTFSRSETNEEDCLEVLAAGGRVAVVFGGRKPARWHGFPVIDGDRHDLRHLDNRNVVVGLTPKGRRAKHDASGFVVWE